jgi:hypothetical protein
MGADQYRRVDLLAQFEELLDIGLPVADGHDSSISRDFSGILQRLQPSVTLLLLDGRDIRQFATFFGIEFPGKDMLVQKADRQSIGSHAKTGMHNQPFRKYRLNRLALLQRYPAKAFCLGAFSFLFYMQPIERQLVVLFLSFICSHIFMNYIEL